MRIAMHALILVWLAISVIHSLAILLPAPNRVLLPLAVAAPELAAWFVVFNAVAVLGSFLFWRSAAIGFGICLAICLWPLIQISQAEHSIARQLPIVTGGLFFRSLRGIHPPQIQAQVLASNILLYQTRQASTPRPILIQIYGGAWQRGEPADNPEFARYMAAKGFAVFGIDYRHAPASQYPVQIEDVRAAIRFIDENAARYGANPNSIILCGRSSGGQLALLAAYTSAIPIKAVISFYGPTDLASGYADPPSPDPLRVRSILEAYLGGPPSQVPDRYHEASPIAYADRPQPPTLLIHGARDHIVLPRFSQELYSKLTASGNRAYLVEIPWAEHAFDAVFFGPGNILALRAIDAFLDTVQIR